MASVVFSVVVSINSSVRWFCGAAMSTGAYHVSRKNRHHDEWDPPIAPDCPAEPVRAVEIEAVHVRSTTEIEMAVAKLGREPVGGLIDCCSRRVHRWCARSDIEIGGSAPGDCNFAIPAIFFGVQVLMPAWQR
jgi:hypothetical protein